MIDFDYLIKKQDNVIKEVIEKQCTDEKSLWYGGFNPADEISRTEFILSALPIYADKRSEYYKNSEILGRMKLNIENLLKFQHKSGLISLMDCNINSPPDTAFTINDLAICHYFIKKTNMPELEPLDKDILKFMEISKKGLTEGGFHTPNHRWVISCALGFLYDIFGDEKLKTRASEYLAEGIDINEDGEWTERSNACYNAVSDLYMYHIGENFGIEEAFDAVRKNLEMMKYLLHPNDYIATEYSTRQDKGKIAHMDARYTIVYQLMAGKYNDEEMAYMAQLGIKNSKNFGKLLLYSGVYEEFMHADVRPKKISNSYIKLFGEKNVAEVPKQKSTFGDSVLRYRNADLSVTIMAGQPDFIFFQYGNARIFGIRLVVGWFGLGGVSFPTIEKVNDTTYRLFAQAYGKYWQTFDKNTAEKYKGNFSKMPNDEREDIGKVSFSAECVVSLENDGLSLEISVDSEYLLFTQLVCMLDARGTLETDDKTELRENVTRQNSSKSVYSCDNSKIEIIGGGSEHDYAVIRGDSLNRDAENLVFNMMSPKNKKIYIKTL